MVLGVWLLLAAFPVQAGDALTKCWSGKLAAGGRYAQALVKCRQEALKEVETGIPETCEVNGRERFFNAWSTSEAKSANGQVDCSEGAMFDGVATSVRSVVEEIVDRITDAIPGELDQKQAISLEKKLLKEISRLAGRVLGAESKHLNKPDFQRHNQGIGESLRRCKEMWDVAWDRAGYPDPDLASEQACDPLVALGAALVESIAVGSPPPTACPLHGLAFSPYVDDQDPNDRVTIGKPQLLERLLGIAGMTERIRTYGSADGLEHTARIARNLDLGTSIGAWLDADRVTNREQIDNLIDTCTAGDVDVAVVGSEVLLRRDLTVAELIDTLDEVKQRCPDDVLVTTAEIPGGWLGNRSLFDAVDLVYLHAFPFWEGRSIDNALAHLQQAYRDVVDAAGSKPVVIAETGWPSAGEPVGEAVPSARNAAAYLRQVVSWVESEEIPLFYFEAFDELWKVADEGERGKNWGLFRSNGAMKKGARPVLESCVRESSDCPRIPDERTPGAPELAFDFVPPKGSLGNLRGKTNFLLPCDHAVVVYIRVGGGYWVKPTFAQPNTPLSRDGRWETDITTGGNDPQADQIQAFLIPIDYDPPLLSGHRSIPAELIDNALDRIQVDR